MLPDQSCDSYKFLKYCDLVIQQIWRIRKKKRDGMTLRPEARVLSDIRNISVVRWILVIGYPNFLSHDPYKSGVLSMYIK